MVRVTCRTELMKSDVDKVHHLVQNLKRIIWFMEKEESRRNTEIQKLNLPLQEPVNNYKHILGEGIVYLSMMSRLYMNRYLTLFRLLLKTMDLYTRLRLKFYDLERERERLFVGEDVTYYAEQEITLTIEFNNDDQELPGFRRFDDEKIYIVNENIVIGTFDLLTELPLRVSLLMYFTTEIKKVYKMYINRSLCSMLRDYGKKLQQFIHHNRDNLILIKYHRKKNFPRKFYCAYRVLEKVLRHIDQIRIFHLQIRKTLKSLTNTDFQDLNLLKSYNDIFVARHAEYVRLARLLKSLRKF